MIRFTLFILLQLCLLSQLSAQKDLMSILSKHLPGAQITELETSDHFKTELEILVPQPIDHFGKSQGNFQQRIFLYHYDFNAPVVYVTEGYSARQRHYELSEIMQSNQITVEYRYFGKSKPEPYDYTYLTNDQAMEDLHRIRKIMGKIYKKEWISTGISKGGTTCLIYKSKYPDDIKVAVPYVAPLAFSQTDKRCDEAILSNGTAACRNKLEAFQHAVLDNREAIIAKLDSMSVTDSVTYNRIGTSAAVEYAVLEFTFSFWQWGHDCELINPDVSVDSLFKNLNRVVGYDFYSDATCDYFEPSYYQFLKENGYYAFIHEPFKNKLKTLTRYDNLPFGPPNQDLSMDHDYLKHVRVWLYHNGDKIIHIQGELDPWGACGMIEVPGQDALHMTKKDGAHRTRISSFGPENRQKIYNALDKWLKAEVHPLKEKTRT
jgi:hypothetical protein